MITRPPIIKSLWCSLKHKWVYAMSEKRDREKARGMFDPCPVVAVVVDVYVCARCGAEKEEEGEEVNQGTYW